MAEPGAERTEPATPRRLEDARRRGQVPSSRDVGALFGLATALVLLLGTPGAALVEGIAAHARSAWSGQLVHPGTLGDFHALTLAYGLATGRLLAPLLAALLVVAALGALVQVGPLFASEALSLRWDRMNPVTGLQRLVSVERLVDLVKALVKLAVLLAVARTVLLPRLDEVLALAGAEPSAAAATLHRLAWALALPVLAVLAVIAVLDVAWTRHRHRHRLRMTRQEVREEALQREGNPHMRARMRQAARELTRQRLLAEVGRADVVVRNPTHFAVALAYDRARMAAPTVLAKGRGRLALRILEIARAHEIPIVEDPPLARLIYRSVKAGAEIPVALYEAIAEVLAYVYRLDRTRAASWGVASGARSAP
ncbi:MAG: flagellar type III secretion system protein FlhB [Deltaproteobacteria bacterium]|nr:flagellar type III secretion system protein FlhB [Deltaproteobacteria bacterium]